jgi:hypothetical protein
MNPRATSSIVAALPSSRMLLLFGGIVLLSESSALATILFVAAGLSFAATLLLATKLYRASARRPLLDEVAQGDGAAAATAVPAPCPSRAGVPRASATPPSRLKAA